MEGEELWWNGRSYEGKGWCSGGMGETSLGGDMTGEGRFTRPAACNFFYILVSTFCV